MYQKQQKWEFRYAVKTAEVAEKIKTCYPKDEATVDLCRELSAERGYRVVSVKKLYPFSTEKNQHNFELISNICSNRMHDMINGEIPYDSDEYDRLDEMKRKADELFCLDLPIAWIPYEMLKDAKELSAAAINHRMDRCIESGRSDLVRYCY